MKARVSLPLVLVLIGGLATSPIALQAQDHRSRARKAGSYGYGPCYGYRSGGYWPSYSGPYSTGYGSYDDRGMRRQDLTDQPADAPESGQAPLRVGERVRTAGPNASLMIGDQVVGTLSPGRVLPVWDVHGPWVGTAAEINGEEVRGWIHIDQLAPVAVATTRMR